MKMKATRWIGMLLVLVLLTGLLPVSAFAAPSGTIKATATLESHFGEGGLTTDEESYTDTAYFSDSWFTKSSFKPNPSLATLSAITGGASYGNGKNTAAEKFARLLEDFGFEDIALNDYYSTNTMLRDSIGCIMGRKTIRDGSGSHTLLAVFFRNAGYRDEWYGDFNIGASGIHADFLAARDETLRFMKQYVETHKVSGDVKVWAAGYSRGAATANLLGGFLAEEKTIDYFDGVSIEPENVFVYAIATPRILPAGLDKAAVWSVAGARTEASYRDHDTAGTAFTYIGSGTVDPGAVQYRGIHNYTAYGDYVTKLPPEGEGWGFTRYGTTEMVEYGSADMRDWLDDIPGTAAATAKTFVGKNYLTPLPERTFDVSTLKLVETGKKITPDAMISERLSALMGIAGSRAGYVAPEAGYQNVLGSAAAIFGKDMGGFYNGVRQATTGTLAKAAVLNYLAYALELQGKDKYSGAENEGIAMVLMQLLEYVGIKKTTGGYDAYSAQDCISDLLDYTLNEKEPSKLMLLATILMPTDYRTLYLGLRSYAAQKGIQPHTVDELASLAVYYVLDDTDASAAIKNMIPKDYQGLFVDFTTYAVSPDVARPQTADDTIHLLTQFLAAYGEAEIKEGTELNSVQQLLGELAYETKPDTKTMVSFLSNLQTTKDEETARAISRKLQKPLKEEDITFLATVLAILNGCNNGVTMDKPIPAYDFRKTMLSLFGAAINWSSVFGLIYENEYSPAVAMKDLVGDILGAVLKDENGNRIRITDAADAALCGLVTLGKTDKIAAYAEELEANPAALRKVAGAILFRPGETYDLASDVKNAVTFIDIIPFLVPAHYHELYISSLKTKDQNYQAPDVPPYYPAGASQPGQSNPFRDISKTDACYDAVLWAYYHQPQITDGVTETTFVPGGTVKRGEAITFLWRAMGCPEPAGSEADCPFTDLTQDYYKKAVRWGYENGIIKGVTETTCDPEQPLSTAHIATLLYRTLNPGADGWYTEAAGWLTAGGYWKTIALAIDTGTDCPRAQVVMALYAMRSVFDKAA